MMAGPFPTRASSAVFTDPEQAEEHCGVLEFPRPARPEGGNDTGSKSEDAATLAERTAAKEARRLERRQETRVLEPWERYRALADLVDGYTDLTEAADRKTRFALLIVGALNAVNILIIAKPDVLSLAVHPSKSLIALYVATYAALSLFLFVHAIGALKPRMEALFGPVAAAARHHPVLPGLRFMGSVVAQDLDGYYEQWQQLEVGQLNRELALHVQVLARANIMKYQ